jgi:DNA-binding SARP family transcriptional activator
MGPGGTGRDDQLAGPRPALAETEVVSAIGELRRRLVALHDDLLERQRRREPAAPSPRGAPAQPPGEAELYATLLGAFALHRGPLRLGLGHHRSVLELGRYLIAHAGRVVPREELLELLWPDSGHRQGIHRLHNAVSKLRRVLDRPAARWSLVRCQDEGYAIERDGLDTDCDRFERLYHMGRLRLAQGDEAAAADAFRAVLELYRGDYLAEVPYAEWAQPHRAHFAERRLNALTCLCDHALRRGELPLVIDYALEVLIADNLRERAHRQVMRAHHGLGQRACAIRQYRLCAALLEKELGVRPSDATQRLHRAIRDDAELPPETPFVP